MKEIYYEGEIYVGLLTGFSRSVNDIYGHTNGQSILLVSLKNREEVDLFFDRLRHSFRNSNHIIESDILCEIRR